MQIGTTQFPRTPQSNYNSRQIIHFTHQEASSHSILHMVQVLHNILRAQKSKQNYSNCGLKICLVHWMLQWPPGPGTKMWLPQTNADGTNLLLQSKMWLVTWKANAQLMHSKQKTNLDIYFSNSVALKMGSGHHTWYEKVKSNTGSSFSLSVSDTSFEQQQMPKSKFTQITSGGQMVDSSLTWCHLSEIVGFQVKQTDLASKW